VESRTPASTRWMLVDLQQPVVDLACLLTISRMLLAWPLTPHPFFHHQFCAKDGTCLDARDLDYLAVVWCQPKLTGETA